MKLSEYQSMKLVETHQRWRTVAFTILCVLVVAIICLIYVPWQQTVIGHGKVTVFSPMQRPQAINAQIDGRIKKWYVHEGEHVKANQLLLELDELNPAFLDSQQLERLNKKREALLAKQNAVEEGVKALDDQISSLSELPKAVLPAAELKIEQASKKLKAAYQAFETAHLNLERRKSLYEKGLRSKRDLELAELDFAKATADLEIAKREAEVAKFSKKESAAEVFAKIQSVQAELAKNHEKLAEIETEIVRIDIEIANLKSRKNQRVITSPVDGQITRVLSLGLAETVKSGQRLAIIVPETTDQAVELFVRDYNAPLLSKGRPVRLQFSGWPAIQFSGWPSIAVGTFGGIVASIDAVDDGRGQFRVLVVPDSARIESGQDVPWPAYPSLRPGTQVQGWILLDTVSIGFELWRQFNGFPPSLSTNSNNEVMLKNAKGIAKWTYASL